VETAGHWGNFYQNYPYDRMVVEININKILAVKGRMVRTAKSGMYFIILMSSLSFQDVAPIFSYPFFARGINIVIRIKFHHKLYYRFEKNAFNF